MAVKTITIDMEAYEILVQSKKGKESFSQVIKKTLSSKRKTARNLLDNLDELLLDDTTIGAVEALTESREESLTASPRLEDGE